MIYLMYAPHTLSDYYMPEEIHEFEDIRQATEKAKEMVLSGDYNPSAIYFLETLPVKFVIDFVI